MNYPDIQILNQRFGAPGRIAFRTDETGFPVVSLINKYGAAEVSLYGAHVLGYRPVGFAPLLFLSKLSAFEPGKPIRGGIPVCWPWFGPHPTDAARDKHGFARLLQWDLDATEYSGETTVLRLSLKDSEFTRRIWDYAFTLKLSITLDQSLNLELITENTDPKPFSISKAFHPYFQVGDINMTHIFGLDHATCLDLLKHEESTQAGALEIQCQVDRTYTPEKNEVAIRDEKLRRATLITFSGTRNLVVWNPWIDLARKLPDMEDNDYQRFVCVEPANVRETAIDLEPGERHTLKMSIQAQLT
ncbi:MAG: D-hexose-6-phosphate mutarotase [bacterium]